jgi:hypothetical protein
LSEFDDSQGKCLGPIFELGSVHARRLGVQLTIGNWQSAFS